MTRRLYYDDAYLCSFDATITGARQREGAWELTLDRSAFYPTSGGQPNDLGTIGELRVNDVNVDGGEVWHAVDAEPRVGERVPCEIDWARRFDHMQQHGGEHLLAGAVWRQLEGFTIGLHVGTSDATIDVTLPDGSTHLSDGAIAALEDEVNAHIQQDAPCRCWFPDEAELQRLPLRKKPTVSEHVRIVAFGDFEMVACGGTHPKSAGEIGLVKILSATPSRGKLRLSFVCGGRAVRDYRMRMDSVDRASAMLSVKPEALPGAVERLKAEAASLKREIASIRRQAALDGAPALLDAAVHTASGALLVVGKSRGLAPDALRELTSMLIEGRDAVALVGSEGESGWLMAFARSNGLPVDAGKLMRQATGGKGGGRPDFAQGAAPDGSALAAAEALALAALGGRAAE